jgi:hypothetical protein
MLPMEAITSSGKSLLLLPRVRTCASFMTLRHSITVLLLMIQQRSAFMPERQRPRDLQMEPPLIPYFPYQ